MSAAKLQEYETTMEEIRTFDNNGDFEAAHLYEDKLLITFLQDIANRIHSQEVCVATASKLAQFAKRSREKWSRWVA